MNVQDDWLLNGVVPDSTVFKATRRRLGIALDVTISTSGISVLSPS